MTDIVERIDKLLEGGGVFNPESAERSDYGDLEEVLKDARREIETLRLSLESRWERD